MTARFASGKNSIAQCDRCGQRFKLKQLRIQTVKTKPFQVKVCRDCYDPDHPQLRLGMYPVSDPQAVRDPRPETGFDTGGLNVLGLPSQGSRVFQWGWAPVGGGVANVSDTPNSLVAATTVAPVVISVE